MSEPRPPQGPLRRRHDMTKRLSERWPPPLFGRPATSRLSRSTAALRRFFDVQAGSLWRDLTGELARPHGTVLDVGCGAQPYRSLLHPADRYMGIDVAAAHTDFGYDAPDTLYYSGDVWPVADASVDLVLCTETLEHVREPAVFLAEAARVTKCGGGILLTVPFSARWHFIPHDYWRFTPSSLRDLLERHGFADVAVYARGDQVTVACDKAMGLIRPLLLPTGHRPLMAVGLRLLGLLFSPLFVLLAIVANLSLLGRGGDDCLGYTAIATRT